MDTKYTLPVEYDESLDEHYITLPEDIVANMNLQEGDVLYWEEIGEKVFALKKKGAKNAD